ncbi:helix-turn-helix domain-containing protein [Sphaerisporangium sp. NPDC004334]
MRTPSGDDAEAILGAHVRELRKRHGWTQHDLAQKLESFGFPLHQSAIARIEAGNRPVRLNEAVVLATLFSVDLPSLLMPPLSDQAMSEKEQQLAELAKEEAQLAAQLDAVEADVTHLAMSLHKAQMDQVAVRAQLAMARGRRAAVEHHLEELRVRWGRLPEVDV